MRSYKIFNFKMKNLNYSYSKYCHFAIKMAIMKDYMKIKLNFWEFKIY
jgi:hypothetical protein